MRRISLLILMGLAVGLFVGTPALLRADGDEIKVTSQRAESDFPNGIRFYIEAESPDEIEDVRVIFKKLGQTSRSSYRVAEFDPGKVIDGEALIRSGRSGEYIPPGTRIAYSFEIRDMGGRVLRTGEEVVVYLDGGFQWQTKTSDQITVFYDYPEVEERAELVLRAARESLELMGPILGIAPTHPLHIVTYSDYRSMSEALPPRAEAVEQQLITQGMAFGEERVLIVYGGDASVESTTRHEFTHLLVADAVGGTIGIVPAWLNEGLAEYSAEVPKGRAAQQLSFYLREDTIRPLRHWKSLSGTPDDIIAGYQQGLSVVSYLISTYGEEKVGETLRVLTRVLDIDDALLEVYGFDQHGLDVEWRDAHGYEPPVPPRETKPAERQLSPTFAGYELPTSTANSASAPQPTRVPTTAPEAIAPAEPTSTIAAAPNPVGSSQEPPVTGSCNFPLNAGSGLMDLSVLVMVGGPLALATAGLLGGRRRQS